MQTFHIITAVAIVSAALGLSCSPSEPPNRPGSAASAPQPVALPLKPAPDFTLTDPKDNSVKLSDYKGKVVVLEWINPDCPYVQRHYRAGTMVGLARRYAQKGVVWLAINTTYYMSRDNNAQWAENHQAPYPVLDDHTGTVGRLYSAKTTPHMFVIDGQGNVVYQGAIDNDPQGRKTEGVVNYVAQALDEVLAGKPVSVPETEPYGCSMKFGP